MGFGYLDSSPLSSSLTPWLCGSGCMRPLQFRFGFLVELLNLNELAAACLNEFDQADINSDG